MKTVKNMSFGGENVEALAKRFPTPFYAYDASIIRARCRELRAAFPTFRLYYACKANSNPEVMKLIFREGFDIKATSPGEIAAARKIGAPVHRISYTCSNVAETEIVSIGKNGILMHLDSLNQVEWYGKHFPGKEVAVRLNTGLGVGVHAHLRTGGSESKFGIPIAHIPKLKKLTKKYRLTIIGLHHHVGTTSFTDATILVRAMKLLTEVAHQFPDLTHLDFGGGFYVRYKPTDPHIDIPAMGRAAERLAKKFFKDYGRTIELSFEPGRFPVCEAGTLYTTVTDIKDNPGGRHFIGINSGMGHLIRPALYDAYHEIENISRPRARKIRATIAGNFCESGDFFAKNRPIARSKIGDILAIKNAGAYGYVMSSDYNLRPRPAEILLESGKARLTRKAR